MLQSDDGDNDEDEDDDDEEEEGTSIKQPLREATAGTFEELADDLEQLFAAIVTTKDGDRDISQAFQLLPQRSVIESFSCTLKTILILNLSFTKRN